MVRPVGRSGFRGFGRALTPLEALTPPWGWSLGVITQASSGPHESPVRAAPVATQGPGLSDQVRQAIQALHYSRRTEKAYSYWVNRFIAHYRLRQPGEMGADEIRCFLSHLAVTDRISASTQNQALCALVFLYRRVLGKDLEPIGHIERAKAPKRLPVVLTRGEVRAVLESMSGVPQLVCRLLYGTGLPAGGMSLRASQGRRLRTKRADRPRRQGGEGPRQRAPGLLP